MYLFKKEKNYVVTSQYENIDGKHYFIIQTDPQWGNPGQESCEADYMLSTFDVENIIAIAGPRLLEEANIPIDMNEVLVSDNIQISILWKFELKKKED